MTKHCQLVLLPGVGADHRLLEPQQRAFPNLVVPPWIRPEQGEGLADYAARLAATIPPGRPLVLGGVSLGGMLAYEMARLLSPEAVLLIASCRTRRGIRPMLRAVGPIVTRLPARLVDLTKPLSHLAMTILPSLTFEQRALCVAMYQDADPRFVAWALAAIIHWEPGPPPQSRVFHIHGQKDLAIPANAAGADEIVPGGGHLINLTHADLVNDFIRRALQTMP